MTTTPLTGYYSTGYYYNSISPRYVTVPTLSGLIIAKAKDDDKLYAYNRHNGTTALSGTILYRNSISAAAPPIIGEGGVVTGTALSITSSPYITAGSPPANLGVSYDSSSLRGVEFWKEGVPGTGTWNNGASYGVLQYVDGGLANGIYQNQFYNFGKLGSTFRGPDGKAYANGNLFSGTVPAGSNDSSLNWSNFNPSVPAPRITVIYTNGLSSLPPSPQRFQEGRLYAANKPFTGNVTLDSEGLVVKYNNSTAPLNGSTVIPLSAINSRFSSAIRNNVAVVSFNQGYPVTGYIDKLYYYKGMSTTNVGVTSYPVYFNNGVLANGIIGNKVYSFGTLISG